MRGDLAQLQARAGDNLSGFICGAGEPADIFAAAKHPLKRLEGLSTE